VKVRGFVVTHPLIQDPKRLVPQIPISIHGTNYPSLVDTGSTISVLSHKVLPKDLQLLPWTEGPIVMLDGSETMPLGIHKAKFQLAKQNFSHSFAVLKKFLLGMDFLHSCGLILHMSNLTWGFSKTYPTESYRLSHSNRRSFISQPSTSAGV
jgi:hypothetical protein